MAKQPKAGIEVGLDERPAIAGLKRLTKEFGATAIAINQSMEIAGKVFGALQAGVSSVVTTMGDAVRAAMEVERVERRAFAAMQTRAGMSREEFDALSALNDARERQLNIDADEQLQLQGTLAALGVRKEALNAATEATIGLAEVTGQGLAEAGKKVAQVLGGNVNALKELGIQARDVADAQGQLQAFFVMAQAQADTLETSVAALGHQWGTLQETLGQIVTQTPEVKGAVDALVLALTDVTDWLSSSTGKQAAREFFAEMLDGAAGAINAILGLRRALQDLSGEGDRQSALSRAGAAIEYGFQSVNVVGLSYATLTGQLNERAAMLADLRARIMGEGGPRPEDSPAIVALEQMANRFTRLAEEARKAKNEIVLDEIVITPTGGAPKGGSRGAKPGEQMSARRSFTLEQINADVIEAEKMRQQAIEQALQAGRQAEADYEEQVAEAKREAMREQWEQTIALSQELHRRGIDVDLAQGRDRLQATLDQSNAMRQMVQQGAEMVSSGLSSMIANMVNGSMSAEDAFRGFVGSLITNLGTMLLNVGTAAVVLGGLSLIPGLQFITGGPGIGIGAGAAAMVAGAGLIAVGAAMGGGSGASARASAPGRGTGAGSMPRSPSSSMGDVVPRGFQGVMAGAVAPYTVNISFSGVVGDERRAARMIQDVLRRGG